jgi:hypothetical protein
MLFFFCSRDLAARNILMQSTDQVKIRYDENTKEKL